MSETDNSSAFFDRTDGSQTRKIKTVEFISNGDLPNAEAIAEALTAQGYRVFDLREIVAQISDPALCPTKTAYGKYLKVQPAIAGNELAAAVISKVLLPVLDQYQDGEGDLKIAILNGPRSLFLKQDAPDWQMQILKENYQRFLGYAGEEFVATCVLYPEKFFLHRGTMSVEAYEAYPAEFDLELTQDITTLPLGVLLGSLERMLP